MTDRTTPSIKASLPPSPPKAPTTSPNATKAPLAADRGALTDRPVTLAAVIGAHGVTGEVRLKLFTEDLSLYPVLSAGACTLTLKSVRPGSNGAVARFAEVPDRNAAEDLRGTVLTVPRSALPPLEPGEYYHADLIGLPCVTPDGVAIGSGVSVENFGAGDILEIERADRTRYMVPVALAVTIEPARLVIDPDF